MEIPSAGISGFEFMKAVKRTYSKLVESASLVLRVKP